MKLNKKTMIVITLILVISLIFTYSHYKKVEESYQYLQSDIDKLFLGSIAQSTEGLSVDYDKMIIDEKIRFYNRSLSGVRMASELLIQTSYNEKNQYLRECLFKFESYLLKYPFYVREVDTGTNTVILERLLQVLNNIENEKITLEFIDLFDEVRSDEPYPLDELDSFMESMMNGSHD